MVECVVYFVQVEGESADDFQMKCLQYFSFRFAFKADILATHNRLRLHEEMKAAASAEKAKVLAEKAKEKVEAKAGVLARKAKELADKADQLLTGHSVTIMVRITCQKSLVRVWRLAQELAPVHWART